MLYKIISFALIATACVAVVFVFDLRPSLIIEQIKNLFSHSSKNGQPSSDPTLQGHNLAETVNYYKGKRENFIKREITNAKKTLAETRQEYRYSVTMAECFALSIIGMIIGVLAKNIFLIPCLGLGLFFIPLWRLKVYHIKYDKYMAMQLESSLSLITASYLRNNDIIESVSENIPNISGFLRDYFEEFIAEYKVNANLKSCIRSLQKKINNPVFREWCDCLIRTYENSDMKENLITIANKLSTIRIVQDDLDAQLHQSIIEFLIMMGILVVVYPLVYVVNKDWFALYATTPGKISIAFTVAVAFYSLGKLFNVMTPIKYEK